MKLFALFTIKKQNILAINDDIDMSIIFFNKTRFGKLIFSFLKLRESRIQTIKFTITEDKIIPTTPKLYGEKLPKQITLY